MNYIITRTSDPRRELYHFGVKGMKWGHRKQTTNFQRDSSENTNKRTAEQKAARRKKAIKIGAAVAGTALAVYGAYKLHGYIRGKNQEIRVKEGKAKCDRMLKKLDHMEIKDRVRGSSGTEKFTNPRNIIRMRIGLISGLITCISIAFTSIVRFGDIIDLSSMMPFNIRFSFTVRSVLL